jgi:SAM-dependent methyltransferase
VDQLSEFARRYDALMLDSRVKEVYGGTDFFNVGYWLADTNDQRTACENLLARLLEAVPATSARVLDAGCGWGASTAYLRHRLRHTSVLGINISGAQLKRSRTVAPDCRFALVDAAQLAFRDGCFDGVVSVEAAFHFRSRAAFLREVYRVLRRGGTLALSDILFADASIIGDWMVPRENAITSPGDYCARLTATGFERVSLKDSTTECWGAFCTAQIQASRRRFAQGLLDDAALKSDTEYFERLRESVGHYVVASARKPLFARSTQRTRDSRRARP